MRFWSFNLTGRPYHHVLWKKGTIQYLQYLAGVTFYCLKLYFLGDCVELQVCLRVKFFFLQSYCPTRSGKKLMEVSVLLFCTAPGKEFTLKVSLGSNFMAFQVTCKIILECFFPPVPIKHGAPQATVLGLLYFIKSLFH